MAKRATISIDLIKEDFFVRQHLNPDHVSHLKRLYESKVDLPFIKVTSEHILIDGRHRLAALKQLDKKSVDVEFVPDADKGAHIAHALRSNVGGPLPPTNGDIIYAMSQMLEEGVTQSSIIKQLSQVWPPAVVRKFADEAQGNLSHRRTIRAKNSVLNEGMTIPEAAALHKIKVETLFTALGGKKSKKNTGFLEIKGVISGVFRSRGTSLGHVTRGLVQRYEDGDLSWKNVEAILDHYDRCVQNTVQSARDLRKRLEALHKVKS